MTTHRFPTPQPAALDVRLHSADLLLHARETDETIVAIAGDDDDTIIVEADGSVISIVEPKRSDFSLGRLLTQSPRITITVTLPNESTLSSRLGRGNLDSDGPLGTATLATGAGNIRIEQVRDLDVASGSGDVSLRAARGPVAAKVGSGNLSIGEATDTVDAVTGSGDISLKRTGDRTTLKSGSGDISIQSVGADLTAVTASGDIAVADIEGGEISLKTVSGDAQATVRHGVPVWTDLNTVTGNVTSELQSLGQPAEGQRFVELRVRTVSGEILARHGSPAQHDTAADAPASPTDPEAPSAPEAPSNPTVSPYRANPIGGPQ